MLRIPTLRKISRIAMLMIGLVALLGAQVGDVRTKEEAPAIAPIGWYVSAVLSGGDSYRITHYWSQGSSMRASTMIGVHPLVTIVRGDRYWVYDELAKQGIEIKRSALAIAEDAKRLRPFANDYDEMIQANGELVETSILTGIAVEVWRVTNTKGRRTLWVTVSEPKVPLRVEKFDRQTGNTITLNYSSWTSGYLLPSSAFEPPADLILEKFEYDQFVAKSVEENVGPAPILFPTLLHGLRPR